jgi:excisionase family DNA binding protein
MNPRKPSEPATKLSFTVAEACSASGLGKTSLYEAIKSGALKSIFVAGRRLILREDLEAYLKSGREAA